MFWAVKANKQMILNGADLAEVLASVPDARCKAWKLKLNGKTAIDPTTLVESTEIGPQMASDVVNLKPQEIFEIVEEELVGKSKEQVDVIKNVGVSRGYTDYHQGRAIHMADSCSH